MSTSLESLMRDMDRSAAPPAWSGFLGFVCVGGAGALAFVALSSLFIGLGTGLADWMVNTLCYGALIVPVYSLHRRFSFHSDAPHGQAMPRYMAVQAMALGLAALFSLLIHGATAMPTPAASTLVIVLTSGVNFLVLRSWAFARSHWAVQAA
ncbi:GtrA family protein [Devosia sp.]|uniref:GtrA family protein n=1 Tax=Devosia sp. TaxID=1871048 RepID=UPI002AFFFFFE|nr:GtrA family protein [Devosia sp.]